VARLQNYSLPGHRVALISEVVLWGSGVWAGTFVKQVVAVLNREGNAAAGVKTVQEQLGYKILILQWSSCGPLHLTRKKEEKVSENIFYGHLGLSVSD